jgi:hypothetical protein
MLGMSPEATGEDCSRTDCHRRRLYNEITKPLFAGQIANEMVTKMVHRCLPSQGQQQPKAVTARSDGLTATANNCWKTRVAELPTFEDQGIDKRQQMIRCNSRSVNGNPISASHRPTAIDGGSTGEAWPR